MQRTSKISHKKRTDSLTYIQTTIQFIRQKYSDPIRIQDIADYCGLNRSYLTRLFKHATGYTPQEYLAQYRINQAKQLLEENERLKRENIMLTRKLERLTMK